MSEKQVEVAVRSCERNVLPLPLQSCDPWMFVEENPDRKKNYLQMTLYSFLLSINVHTTVKELNSDLEKKINGLSSGISTLIQTSKLKTEGLVGQVINLYTKDVQFKLSCHHCNLWSISILNRVNKTVTTLTKHHNIPTRSIQLTTYKALVKPHPFHGYIKASSLKSNKSEIGIDAI